MDYSPAKLKSERGIHLSPISTLTRTHRRQKLIIYRHSTDDQEGPVLEPHCLRKQDKLPTTQCTAGRRKALQAIPLGHPQENLEEGDVECGLEGRKRRKLSESNCQASRDSVGSYQQKHRRWKKDLTIQASPIERARRRVLTVVLQDLASQEPEEEKVEDSTYLASTEELKLGNRLTLRRLSEGTEYRSPIAKLPVTELSGEESHESPSNSKRATPEVQLLAPSVGDSLSQETGTKCYQGWRIGPLFHSMRCKLETFAEILLTPVKNKWALSESTNGPTVSEAVSLPLREDKLYTEGEETAVLHQEEAAIIQDPLSGARVSPTQPGMKIEVKIAISEPQASSSSLSPPCSGQDFSLPSHRRRRRRECGEVSCRPPIRQWRSHSSWGEWISADDDQGPPGDSRPPLFQPRLSRSYSCPNFPSVVSSPTSLLLAGSSQSGRQRRHTVCSMEVSRELGHNTFTLPCLKKEVFPFSTGGTSHLQHCPLSPVVSLPHCELLPEEPSSDPMLSRVSSPHQVTPHRGSRSWGSFDHMQPGPSDTEPLLKEGQLSLQILEESSFSDSEIKNMDSSQSGSKGKVSRFRIRKTPAKQQTNLTPMGLPKPVRTCGTYTAAL